MVVSETSSGVAALELRSITKRFGTTVANDSVSVSFRPGRVHAVVGENGAGKTTLMNCAYGLTKPDAGDVLVDGREVSLENPRHALGLGIGMIHQHFKLVPSLTAAENVVLGACPSRRGSLDRARVAERVAAVCEKHDLLFDLNARVRDMPVGIQQRVEIVKMLYRDARVLILDEPTAVLTPQEADALIRTLRATAESGSAVVFISHKLREVLDVADDITVMRQGRVIGHLEAEDADRQRIARMMVGRDVPQTMTETRSNTGNDRGEPALQMEEVECHDDRGRLAVRGVSLSVSPGRIFCIAGVEGNGQSELTEAVVGIRPVSSGRIDIGGQDVTRLTPRARRDLGLGHIPADRMRSGVCGQLTVATNLIATRIHRQPFSRLGWLNFKAIAGEAKRLAHEFHVTHDSLQQSVSELSGGNIQKVVVAREMAEHPDVLVAVNPTRGVDIGSIETIHGLLRELRDRGAAILLISSELDEARALADELVVMYGGRIGPILDPGRTSDTELGLMMAGLTPEPTDA